MNFIWQLSLLFTIKINAASIGGQSHPPEQKPYRPSAFHNDDEITVKDWLIMMDHWLEYHEYPPEFRRRKPDYNNLFSEFKITPTRSLSAQPPKQSWWQWYESKVQPSPHKKHYDFYRYLKYHPDNTIDK